MTFEYSYIEYFARMKRFAENYVVSESDAENIVQDIFAMLWEKQIDLNAQSNLTGYLLVTLKNKCLDHLKHKKVKKKHEIETALNIKALEGMNADFYNDDEIYKAITKSIDKLPKRCREIFIKSKIEGKKNKEIAQELNISINTVENQMGIAFKKIREDLKDNFILVLIFFL